MTVELERVERLLTDIRLVLKELALWSEEQPDASLLASSEPFCIDTMTAPQWLQWVFIPRMTQLIVSNKPLPTRFALAPYFEEALSQEYDALLSLVRELDLLLNRES